MSAKEICHHEAKVLHKQHLDSSASGDWPELAALPSLSSRRLLSELRVLAVSPMPITVVGPSGTGKTGIARGIHDASPRRGGPFVMQNVSILSDTLAGSEFYGHERGAFTGAVHSRKGRLRSADGGTLVVDELTKAPASVQHHLLDILDGRPVFPVGSDREVFLSVRVVALTSVPLDAAAKSGALIPDLFERLRTTVVRVAALEDRADDILPVVRIALERWSAPYGYRELPTISPELARVLVESRWPGNHRQVDGVVQRLLARAQGAPELTVGLLPSQDAASERRGARERFIDDYRSGAEVAHAGPTEAGKHYGVDRATVRRWIRTEESSARIDSVRTSPTQPSGTAGVSHHPASGQAQNGVAQQ
jgi:DNA-binding NtrC family response regulator